MTPPLPTATNFPAPKQMLRNCVPNGAGFRQCQWSSCPAWATKERGKKHKQRINQGPAAKPSGAYAYALNIPRSQSCRTRSVGRPRDTGRQPSALFGSSHRSGPRQGTNGVGVERTHGKLILPLASRAVNLNPAKKQTGAAPVRQKFDPRIGFPVA